MSRNLEDFIKDKMSFSLTCFRRNHRTQHCLDSMLEDWKKIENGEIIGGTLSTIQKLR